MSNFEFNVSVPATDNNPSVDQPQMLINTTSENSIWAVDHISYNSNNGGTHLQTSFSNFQTNPVLPSDPGANNPSIGYPAAGGADVTNAQYYFNNPLAQFLLSSVKAFGVFTTAASVTTLGNSFNVLSISGGSGMGGTYLITLKSGVVIGQNVVVFANDAAGVNGVNWSFTNPVLTLFGVSLAAGHKISFVILQS